MGQFELNGRPLTGTAGTLARLMRRRHLVENCLCCAPVRARAPTVPVRADINAPILNSKLTHYPWEALLDKPFRGR